MASESRAADVDGGAADAAHLVAARPGAEDLVAEAGVGVLQLAAVVEGGEDAAGDADRRRDALVDAGLQVQQLLRVDAAVERRELGGAGRDAEGALRAEHGRVGAAAVAVLVAEREEAARLLEVAVLALAAVLAAPLARRPLVEVVGQCEVRRGDVAPGADHRQALVAPTAAAGAQIPEVGVAPDRLRRTAQRLLDPEAVQLDLAGHAVGAVQRRRGAAGDLQVAQHVEREEVDVDDAVVRLVDRHAVEGEEDGALVEATHVDARLAAAALADVDAGSQLDDLAELALARVDDLVAVDHRPRRQERVDRARLDGDLLHAEGVVLRARGGAACEQR